MQTVGEESLLVNTDCILTLLLHMNIKKNDSEHLCSVYVRPPQTYTEALACEQKKKIGTRDKDRCLIALHRIQTRHNRFFICFCETKYL